MQLTPEQTAQLKAAIDRTMENLAEALTAGGPSPFHAELCITQADAILKSIQSAAVSGKGGGLVGTPVAPALLQHGGEAVMTTRAHNMLRQLNQISTTS